MRYPAADFHICPCCGTEFGYSDANIAHSALRAAWLREGAHWWNPVELPPPGWDPYQQLNNLICAPPDLESVKWDLEGEEKS